jgi:hypothetical protein
MIQRLRLALIRLLEKMLGRFKEGPPPPPRYAQSAQLFGVYHRGASAYEWRAFAVTLAENAYRDGFMRGYQWKERGSRLAAVDPREMIDGRQLGIRPDDPRLLEMMERGVDPRDPLAQVPEEELRQVFGPVRGLFEKSRIGDR